jgi:iron complex outermembrane recepter protein
MNFLKPNLILLSILAAYATPILAENKAEALETEKVEVVGTTPLPSIGTPINQVPSNVQTGSAKSIDAQQSLDLSEYLDNNLGSVNTSNTVANPYQADVQFRGFTASPLLGTPQGLSVYLDGVRVNEPFGDIVNWDLIPSNAIANINLIHWVARWRCTPKAARSFQALKPPFMADHGRVERLNLKAAVW